MKALKLTNTLFLGMTLLMTTVAFAAEKGSMKLIQPAMIGGVQLAPGEYNLSWEGSGPSVELKIAKGGKVVATAPARTVELKSSAPANGTATKQNAEGTPAVSQIFFHGKTQALEIATDSSAEQSIAQKK